MENTLRSRIGLLKEKVGCSVEEISGAFGKDLYYTDGAAANYDFVIVIGKMTRIFVSEKREKYYAYMAKIRMMRSFANGLRVLAKP